MTFVDQFNSKTDILMNRLRSFSDQEKVIDLSIELKHTTLDAIAQVFIF